MKQLLLRYLLLMGMIFSITGSVYAQSDIGKEEVQELWWGGVKKGWSNIFEMKNVALRRGELSRLDVTLADYSPVVDENTDLLLTFDHSTMHTLNESYPNYTLGKIDIFPSTDKTDSEKKSAGFLRFGNIVELMPSSGSVFLSDTPVKSFTIDFSMYPTTITDGGSVVEWYAPTVETDGKPTGFKAFFRNGRLYWLFENVFYDSKDSAEQILIGELDKTPVHEWHHHALFYDADSGLLTLFYDGRESALTWLTETGTEGGTLLQGRFSRYLAVDIMIGKQFLGFIDNFRITRGRATLYSGRFVNEGRLVSDVLDMKNRGTKLLKFRWESSEEFGTAIRFFCRVSNTYFQPNARPNEESTMVQEAAIPEWVPVRNNSDLPEDGFRGRYVQWKAELYGTQGLYSPSLHSLTVFLEPDRPPLPPLLIEAVPLDSGVRLRWIKNREKDIQGYMVYYGNSPKTYFGTGADPGDSPVSVGNTDTVTVHGLENEAVYFISITAVDRAGQESGFSREVIVRPSMIHGRE